MEKRPLKRWSMLLGWLTCLHARSPWMLRGCCIARSSTGIGWGNACIVRARGHQTCFRAYPIMHADGKPRHTAPPRAQLLFQHIVGAAGWSTIVRAQDALNAHGLSTPQADLHLCATLTCACCARRQAATVRHQLQLAAQTCQATAHTNAEQAVIAHLDEALGQAMLEETTQELLNRKGAGGRLAALANRVAERDLVMLHADTTVVAACNAKDVGCAVLKGAQPISHRAAIHHPRLLPDRSRDAGLQVQLPQCSAHLGPKQRSGLT